MELRVFSPSFLMSVIIRLKYTHEKRKIEVTRDEIQNTKSKNIYQKREEKRNEKALRFGIRRIFLWREHGENPSSQVSKFRTLLLINKGNIFNLNTYYCKIVSHGIARLVDHFN